MIILMTAAAIALARIPTTPVALPACQYEDGNTDGQACTWTDPDTGRAYFVDSANYRG